MNRMQCSQRDLPICVCAHVRVHACLYAHLYAGLLESQKRAEVSSHGAGGDCDPLDVSAGNSGPLRRASDRNL